MSTKTVTIDTGEWAYPDFKGDTHMVTNGETFTFELTDDGTTGATWAPNVNCSLKCTDGSRVEVLAGEGPEYNIYVKDAQQGAVSYGLRGSFKMHSNVGDQRVQIWHPAAVNIDDADAPTAITGTFEDQYGNKFTWTSVTVS